VPVRGERLSYNRRARGLSEAGVIHEDYKELLLLMAGYRNRLVHFYHEVTPTELYAIILNHRRDIVECTRQVLDFVESKHLAREA